MSMIDYYEADLRERGKDIADRLRRQADEIERSVEQVIKAKDNTHANEIDRASWIVNSLNFLIPNLASQNLITTAAKLHEARRVEDDDDGEEG